MHGNWNRLALLITLSARVCCLIMKMQEASASDFQRLSRMYAMEVIYRMDADSLMMS